jgi:elongation factor G
MAKYTVESLRNIVLCGHRSAGKTTLVDKLLGVTKTISRPASVDDGTSICDFDEEEKGRKFTIEAKVVHFDYANEHFTMIDTPGSPDFIGQTIEALRGVDTAAIVINAQSGIEVNTRRVFAEAGKAKLARMIVLNKLDGDNIDFPALVEGIRELFGKACLLFNVPLGLGPDFHGVASTLKVPADTKGAAIDPAELNQALIESIVEVDEAATERYFEGIQPTEEELPKLIVRAMAQGSLIPMVCVSGKNGVGLTELLEAFAECSVPPNAMSRTATDAEGKSVEVKADPAGPLVAQVFKTRIDPFVQKLSVIRVFSGTLKKDETIAAVGARKGIKIGPLFLLQANETTAVDELTAGQIGAVAKAEDLHTGTALGQYAMPPMVFPTPMVGLAVTPKSRGDETKLSGALHKVVEEDPTFRLDRDVQTKELVMTGMSELHLLIIQERLKRRDKVEVETKVPKIPYRETVQAQAEGMYRHKKQTGGRGQFGEVHIRVMPLPKDSKIEEFCTKARFPSMRAFHHDPEANFVWIDSIVGGTIPNNFLPAVEKGFKERLVKGVIAGYQVQDVCVEVFFGKHHPVDSSEQAFKTAGSMAFRNVFQQAKPGLLEPIVKMEVTVPQKNLGDISSDMSGRRGRVLGMDSAGGDMQTVTVVVPLAEVTTYARTLSSVTGGQGSYTMEFSHYDVVPGNVQREIIEKAQLAEEEEE